MNNIRKITVYWLILFLLMYATPREIVTEAATVLPEIQPDSLVCMATMEEETPELDKSVTICVGKRIRLKVKGTTQEVKWKSTNKKIVKVSKKGTIRGVKKGTATVTAQVGAKTLTCKVKVKDAVKGTDRDITMQNVNYFEIDYLSNSIECKSKNPEIAQVEVLDYGYDATEGVGVAGIVIYGMNSGTTEIVISNDCNKKKVRYDVIVEKSEADTGKQRLIDYMLKYGQTNELGDKVLTRRYEDWNGEAVIEYSCMDETINFSYSEIGESAEIHWNLMPTEKPNTEYYITMWLDDVFVTATVDLMSYEGEDLVFEEGWYGIPAEEECQERANSVSKRAFESMKSLLYEETGLEPKDMF